MVIMAHIHSILYLTIHGRHDVSDLEAYSTNFNKVFLLQAVAGHFHIQAAVVPDDSPYFLFRLLLKHLLNRLVHIVLVEDPVGTVLVH